MEYNVDPEYVNPPPGRDDVLVETDRSKRLEICSTCPEYVSYVKMCGMCKCFMPLKSWIKGAVCPAGKW